MDDLPTTYISWTPNITINQSLNNPLKLGHTDSPHITHVPAPRKGMPRPCYPLDHSLDVKDSVNDSKLMWAEQTFFFQLNVVPIFYIETRGAEEGEYEHYGEVTVRDTTPLTCNNDTNMARTRKKLRSRN